MTTKFYSAKVELKDEKSEAKRYRNILANSGEIMESGEVRDLDSLYVMSTDGTLIKISDLNKDPEKQTEHYQVKAQSNHGELIDGEMVPSIEKQFGGCKVWLEDDGLHARMYFADNDQLADHAWAISEFASYSTGIDWYPDGYYGSGLEITEPIGILREISMVLTGNDPRSKTIDHKPTEAKGADGAADEVDGEQITNDNKGEDEMSEAKKDALTPEENRAIKEALAEVADRFTTDVPEDETQPTARDSKEEAEEVEAPKEESKDTLRMPHITIVQKQDSVKQEYGTADKKADAKQKLTDAIKASKGQFDTKFNDAISGLADPLNVEVMFTEAMEKSDGIISFFNHVNAKGLSNNVLAGTDDEGGRAKGHKKGDTKADQDLTNTIRNVYCKMVYKKLSLDAMEVYENPELVEFRARELVENIIKEIERAAIIGDGRTAPSGSNPDYRMFDGVSRGFFSVKADAAAASGYGSLVASTYTTPTGGNLYDAVVGARGLLMTEGRQALIAKPSVMTAAFQAKVGSDYLIAPGSNAEDIFRVARVFAPQWMENDTNDAYLIVDGAYTTVGETQVRVKPFFDVSTNQDVLLDETPRGGTLTKYKSAVAIAPAE